jgi:hypothetical protein
MSFAKLALICAAAALTLSACGTINVKPTAATGAAAQSRGRGRIDDPRTTKSNHVMCLRADKIPVREVGTTALVAADSVRVQFLPTPGAAQAAQIENQEQSAEAIGSALLYPGQASDAELTKIERCIAQGVSG